MKCKNCGAPIEIDFNMCPYCGMSMKDMIDADDVYDKMDDMDDKLDNIQSKLKAADKAAANYTPHPSSKAEETMGKVAASIFFVVFFIVTIIILVSAVSMCSMGSVFF